MIYSIVVTPSQTSNKSLWTLGKRMSDKFISSYIQKRGLSFVTPDRTLHGTWFALTRRAGDHHVGGNERERPILPLGAAGHHGTWLEPLTGPRPLLGGQAGRDGGSLFIALVRPSNVLREPGPPTSVSAPKRNIPSIKL